MGKPESDVELEKTLEAAAQIKWNKDYTENNTSVVFYCLGFYPAQLNMAALLCVPFFFFFFKPKWLNVLVFFITLFTVINKCYLNSWCWPSPRLKTYIDFWSLFCSVNDRETQTSAQMNLVSPPFPVHSLRRRSLLYLGSTDKEATQHLICGAEHSGICRLAGVQIFFGSRL